MRNHNLTQDQGRAGQGAQALAEADTGLSPRGQQAVPAVDRYMGALLHSYSIATLGIRPHGRPIAATLIQLDAPPFCLRREPRNVPACGATRRVQSALGRRAKYPLEHSRYPKSTTTVAIQ